MSEPDHPAGAQAQVGNARIAELIGRYADLLEIDGANPFRIRAYRHAVDLIADGHCDMIGWLAAGRDLQAIPGIGAVLASKVATIARTGALPQLAALEERIPAGLVALAELPGLDPRHVGTLHRRLGIGNIADLRRAVAAGQLDTLAGFKGERLARLRAALGACGG